MDEDWKHRYMVTIFCAGDSDDEVYDYISSHLPDGPGFCRTSMFVEEDEI